MATTTPIILHPRFYTVAWLCAIPHIEMKAAVTMLDRKHDVHESIGRNPSYKLGDIHEHNVVIASMPPSSPGKVSAHELILDLRPIFPNLKIYLFVGIGGGVPCHPQPEDPLKDVRLGDVVVGWPEDWAAPAVIQHDLLRRLPGHRTQLARPLNQPKRELYKALIPILCDDGTDEQTCFADNLRMLESREPKFKYPGRDKDVLYKANYEHPSTEDWPRNCNKCSPSELVTRVPRQTDDLVFHRSTILSGDTLVMDALERDRLSVEHYNAKCIEMEAAGVMNDAQCLVIRGISDYADSHQSDPLWKYCAAARAAAWARKFLHGLPVATVQSLPSAFPDGIPVTWVNLFFSGTETNPQGRNAQSRNAGVSHQNRSGIEPSPANEFPWASSNDTRTYPSLQLRYWKFQTNIPSHDSQHRIRPQHSGVQCVDPPC